MKGVPSLTLKGLRTLLEKKKGWVEWLTIGKGDVVCHGEVVCIVIWCLQNPNDSKVAEWDDMKAVVLSLRGYAHINFVSLICLLQVCKEKEMQIHGVGALGG